MSSTLPPPSDFNQFWRCPVCDSRMAAGEPGRLHPPFCSFGHDRAEMEQVTAEGFTVTREDAA